MKKLLFTVCALLSLACRGADHTPTHMIIEFDDNTNVAMALGSKPQVLFGDNMMLSLDDGTGAAPAKHPFSSLKAIRLGIPVHASVDEISFTDPAIIHSRNSIILSNFPAGTPVAIYSIAGQKMLHAVTDGDVTLIDCSQLTSGAYIITASGKSIKFIK